MTTETIKTTPWDAAHYIETPEEVVESLAAAAYSSAATMSPASR